MLTAKFSSWLVVGAVALAGCSAMLAQNPSGALRPVNAVPSDSGPLMLNGHDVVAYFTLGIGQPVPLDSVQEFSVSSGVLTADLGRAGGGVVNVAGSAGEQQLAAKEILVATGSTPRSVPGVTVTRWPGSSRGFGCSCSTLPVISETDSTVPE